VLHSVKVVAEGRSLSYKMVWMSYASNTSHAQLLVSVVLLPFTSCYQSSSQWPPAPAAPG